MIYGILYNQSVVKDDLPKISHIMKKRIKNAIEKKLATKPELLGKPLRRSLAGYRKLRIGDWRVIFKIEKEEVKILAIQHRSMVYKHVEKRIYN